MKPKTKPKSKTRPLRLIINSLVTAIAIAIPVLITEAVLRSIHPIPAQRTFTKKDFYYDEQLTGTRFKSGTNSKMTNIEFNEYIYISQSNTRVDSPHKTSQTIQDLSFNQQGQTKQTMFAIGDSQTFGHGLPAEESWPSQLNKKIGSKRYHVANFGAPGTDTNQFSNLTIYLNHKYPNNNLFILGISDNDLCQAPSFASDGDPIIRPETQTDFIGPDLGDTAQTHDLRSILNSFSTGKSLISIYRRAQGASIQWAASQEQPNIFARELLKKINAKSQRCAESSLSWFKALDAYISKHDKTVIFVLIPSGELLLNEAHKMLTIEQKQKLQAVKTISTISTMKGLHILNTYPVIRELLNKNLLRPQSIMLVADGHSNRVSNERIAEEVKSYLYSHSLLNQANTTNKKPQTAALTSNQTAYKVNQNPLRRKEIATSPF